MTIKQSDSIEQGEPGQGTPGDFFSSGGHFDAEDPNLTFGHRLHAAREARQASVESCAQTLRLPARVLRQLETNQCDATESKIYLASYITKYARYLGLDEALIQAEVERIKHIEPPLVATGGISHSRFLFDRYATAATYVVLTAVIVVPMLWLGVRGTLDHSSNVHLSALDAVPVTQQDVPAASASTAAKAGVQVAAIPVSAPAAQQPLMASMAPFPDLDTSATTVAPLPAASTVPDTGGHSLSLNLSAASWVEVTDSAGTRLEYGLLPAGSVKTYHSDQPLDVRIGNAIGAQVSIDGQAVALDAFRHANVAHFRVQMQDGKASAAAL